MELFKQMDIERKKTETQSRLIDESELPDWLVKEDDEVICNKVTTFKTHVDPFLRRCGTRDTYFS